jgi:beta-lactamase class A
MTAVRRLLGVALALALSNQAHADNYFPSWPVQLQSDVVRASRTFPGEFAVYVKDLATGTRYEYNSATPIYLASTIKLAVMIELFRQVEAKQISLDEELVYSAPDIRDGAPLLSFLRIGTPVSIQILLEAMIQQSDNAATDILIRHIGLDNVNRGLVKEGLFGFGPITTLLDVRRLMYQHIDPGTADLTPQQIFTLGVTRPLDMRLQMLTELLDRPPQSFTKLDWNRAFESYYELGYNTGPLEAVGTLLEALERGKIVNAARSRQMIEIMLGTQTGPRRMRAGLPPGTLVAHKTGTQYRRICDVGIFYMATNRPIVFAVCVKGGKKRQAEDVIARVARRTYWHLSPPAERKNLRFPAEASVALPEDEDDEYDEDEDLLAPAVGSKLKGPPKRKVKKKPPPPPPAKKLMK